MYCSDPTRGLILSSASPHGVYDGREEDINHTKRRVIGRKEARSALRSAKKAHEKRSAAKSKTWKKGGHEWSKVLGHFGVTRSVKK